MPNVIIQHFFISATLTCTCTMYTPILAGTHPSTTLHTMLLTTLLLTSQYCFIRAKSLQEHNEESKQHNKTKTNSELASCSHGSRQCLFPFIFNNRIITSCTTIDGDTTPWCATAVNTERVMTRWGYCTQDCPGVREVMMYIHPDNSVGSCGE